MKRVIGVLRSWIFLGTILLSATMAAGQEHELDKQSKGMPLVFSEDFERGTRRWETTDDTAWTLYEEDGNHVFGLNRRVSNYQPPYRSPHNLALIKDLELTDFVMFVRVKSTKDTGGHRDCCIFFGHQDPAHFYYVHLGAKPDPHSGQIMIVNDAPRRAITENTKEIPWDDQWHWIKVVREGASGLIEVYFDDMEEPIMRAVDTTFTKGRLGIGSFDDMNNFDDVRIYGQ
ncbi:MAG: hypothetical protein KatS3mg111_0185 [Pirellulaceae bacterium]|nr:MAG: hypothetical protein KatS3mg111_0185 [Pirellulaceae bacterium]